MLAGVGLAFGLVLCTLLAACTGAPTLPAASPGLASGSGSAALPPNTFQILHTNDIHGHLDSQKVTLNGKTFEQGGMALLGGMIQQERARAPERTLVVDSGDMWVGTLMSAADRGHAVIQAMSLIGYQAAAVGNHEFDWGQDVLAARAKEATFPLLAANLVEDSSGKPPGYVKPYVIQDLGVAKVGLIALTFPDPKIIKASSVQGLRFLPAVESVGKILPEVKRQADVIVVLSHLSLAGDTRFGQGVSGGGGDTELATAFPDIDVIIGAHDHLAFQIPHVVGKTKIFETGSYTQNLGRVQVGVDPATHKVASVQSADVLLPVTSAAAPPLDEVTKLVAARRADTDRYALRVVGKATGVFPLDRDMNAPLGNLVADAILDYGVAQGWKSDVSFYNGAGIRAPLAAGDITYGGLAEVLPFQNTIVNVDLTGDQLREVFEGMAGAAGRLFMSGGTMAYRPGEPTGKRVTGATVGGRPLDPARLYHVATIDYLLGGGDGHTGFKKGTDVIYGDLDVDVAAAYLVSHSPVSPSTLQRVTAK